MPHDARHLLMDPDCSENISPQHWVQLGKMCDILERQNVQCKCFPFDAGPKKIVAALCIKPLKLLTHWSNFGTSFL